MPLAANIKRLNTLFNNSTKCSNSYDVTFLGRLYDDETNFYNQISYLPPYYKGFFEGIINTQMNLYGIDLSSYLITDKVIEDIATYIKFDTYDELFLTDRDFIIEMIQKKITEKERIETLQLISEKYELTHFAPTRSNQLPRAHYGGYVDYVSEMPLVFNNSKININISLRSILSGVPLRCIDIMAAGGFLISNYQQELSELFEPDKDLVIYESRADLMNKIEYYLSHDDERESIARNGQAKVAQNFDYMCIVPRIFDIVFPK
jgi:spore maturation protein CgeB